MKHWLHDARTAAWLAAAYLRERALASSLHALLLGAGVATVLAVNLVAFQLDRRSERDAAGIDLVVGAKGSPLQLVLSSVYHVDVPTGNIAAAAARSVATDPRVRNAVPLALGDSHRGARIVGSEVAAFLALYGATVASGRQPEAALEAILGSEVARRQGLAVGSRFAGSHGLGEGGGAHESHPFTVTGILAPTGSVLDRLIVTPLESVWQVHGVSVAAAVPDKDRHAHHEQDAHRDVGREITALLLQYATPLAAATLQRHVNSQSQLQAASPAAELSRLFGYLGSGAQVIKGIALALLAIGAAGIFAGLGSALSDRAADLALLRLLGAPRRVVVLAVLLQGLLLGIAGVILGLALGHGAAERISALFAQRQGAGFDAWQAAPGEPWLLAGTLALALLAAAVPAWRVYRRAMPQWLARL